MKLKKLGIIAAMAALVGCMALAGCGSSSSTGDLKLLNEGKLTVATSPDFPPFENLENGEYVGLDMDIAKAVAEKMGLEFNPVTIQFDGIIPAIVAGGQADIAISGITVEPERAEQVDFSTSYYVDDQSIVVMKGGDITNANVDEELDKAGVIIAVQTGTTGETYAQEHYPNATVKGYGNANDSFAALASGQANAVITNKAVGESMISKSYTDAEVVKAIATGEEYAIAVSKDNKALTEKVNAALKELTDAGTIDELVQKHMS